MARLPRLAIDRQVHLVVHRLRPDAGVSADAADRRACADALRDLVRELRIDVHAYAVLPDAVLLLLTPALGASLPVLMQRLGRRHVGALSRHHALAGSPWAGRYRVGVLQPERYLLTAMRWVEESPSRAGWVTAPADWEAGSAAHHAGRRQDPVVTDHPLFWQLGNTPFERERAWQRLAEEPPDRAAEATLLAGVEAGWAVGDPGFIQALSMAQARRLQPLRRGRPTKRAARPESDPN